MKGHFRLTSGLHSGEYLQSALVLRHPTLAAELGARLAVKLKVLGGPAGIALTVSPALGGLIVGHEVARALETPFLFMERDAAGKMALRRGFTVEPGTRVAVVEDVVTTGGSTREVIEVLALVRSRAGRGGRHHRSQRRDGWPGRCTARGATQHAGGNLCPGELPALPKRTAGSETRKPTRCQCGGLRSQSRTTEPISMAGRCSQAV